METAVSTGSTLNITASINPTITTPVPMLTMLSTSMSRSTTMSDVSRTIVSPVRWRW